MFIFQMVLLEYTQSGQKDKAEEETNLISFVLALGVFVYNIELSCYIYIFIYLYKHNNGLILLSTETKKFRNRCNAHTLMGQIFLFVNEMIYLIVFFAAFSLGEGRISTTHLKDLFSVYKHMEFGIVSVVQCFLVPELRHKMEEFIFNKFRSRCLHLWE